MKKILLLILSFIICITFVNAKEIDLSNSIIEFNELDGYNLQGFTTTNTHLFTVFVSKNDTKSIIKVFDLSTYKEVITITGGTLGHANDATYNSKTNEIYVISASGSSRLNIFDGDSFRYKNSFELNLPVRSITYLDDSDKYAVRLITTGFILNNQFVSNKLPFIVGMNVEYDTGRQGWAYYNKYIYYTNWSWVRKGGDGTNSILVYNLDGKKIDEYLTSDKIGELEDIAFHNNKMILGFNCYDGKVRFYLEDIPSIEIKEKIKEPIVEAEMIKKKTYSPYIIISIIVITFIGLIIFLKKKKTSNK